MSLTEFYLKVKRKKRDIIKCVLGVVVTIGIKALAADAMKGCNVKIERGWKGFCMKMALFVVVALVVKKAQYYINKEVDDTCDAFIKARKQVNDVVKECKDELVEIVDDVPKEVKEATEVEA